MSESNSSHRCGIFGGTFDPIHVGHLLVAEFACEALELEQIRFIPAATAPHKIDRESAAAKHRWEMLGLAIGGNPRFVADDRELRRGGTSYTVDTLRELRSESAEQELVFIMGADSLAELHTWRDPAEICRLAFVAILARGGQPQPDLNLLKPYLSAEEQANLLAHLVPTPQFEISSTDIRLRVSRGKSVRYQLHPAVEAYIAAQQLYQ
jgi:nicotinate-nucleotide adenylyltransferase